jgi:hypothetical protein
MFGEVANVVTKGAALRGAPARAWDLIPPVRQRLPGLAGSWIDIDDGEPTGHCGQIEFATQR